MTYDKKGNIILCPELYKRFPKKYQVLTQEQIRENAKKEVHKRNIRNRANSFVI